MQLFRNNRKSQWVAYISVVALFTVALVGYPKLGLLTATNPSVCDYILNFEVQTDKGFKPYSYLFETAYKPLKFKLCTANCRGLGDVNQVLPLFFSKNCSEIFQEWLTIQKSRTQDTGIREFPLFSQQLKEKYLLNGLVRYHRWMFNNTYDNPIIKPRNWTEAKMQMYEKALASDPINYNSFAYGKSAKGVIYAFKEHPPTGHGLIIGSITPWLEFLCLRYGASKLTTAEYMPINCTHPRIKIIHPWELASNWKEYRNRFDFVASYSSIEHSGLGRYGDPIDPYGDIAETQKVHCLLKPGGLFYLGLPTGTDLMAFNAGRCYGGIRWPMVAAGFKVLGQYDQTIPRGMGLLRVMARKSAFVNQPVIVLEKGEENQCA